MAQPEDRNEDNAPGRYYVDSSCIDCDLCRETAPAFFRRNESLGQSIVHRQPATAEEMSLCDDALQQCPTDSIGSDGE